MIAALLLALVAGQAAAPPQDWTTLPIFPLAGPGVAKEATDFVRGEVEAARCRVGPVQPDGTRIAAPVAILVGPAGGVRQIVPGAIDCPTVEQYTVGYLLSLTRAAPTSPAPPRPGWYRLTVSYRW